MLPAETCTVMVFIPSTENANVMLPSRVISGYKHMGREGIRLLSARPRLGREQGRKVLSLLPLIPVGVLLQTLERTEVD